MLYSVVDEMLDVKQYLLERTVPFPSLNNTGPYIRKIANSWAKITLDACVCGGILSQLEKVFSLTWSKKNTQVPEIRNVFRHDGKIYRLVSTETLIDMSSPPELVVLDDSTETMQQLVYGLFVMHREFVLSTKFDKLFGTPGTWDEYNNQALPGIPQMVLAPHVNEYEPWMEPLIEVVREGIQTYDTPILNKNELATTLVSSCRGCGWSHPDAWRTKRHIAACRHVASLQEAMEARTDDADEDHEQIDPTQPVQMVATIHRFDGTKPRLAQRNRRVDEETYSRNFVPAGCDTTRIYRAFAKSELDDIVPFDLGALDETMFQDAIVHAFDKLFGRHAIEDAYRAFFKRDGHIYGFIKRAEKDGTIQRSRIAKVSLLEVVHYTIDTIIAVWNKATGFKHAMKIMEMTDTPINGMSIAKLDASIDVFDLTHQRSWWMNLCTRIRDCVPAEHELAGY